MVPDPEQRAVIQEVVRLREAHNPPISWAKISDQIEAQLAARENRRPLPRWARRRWSPKRCREAYIAEKRFRPPAQNEAQAPFRPPSRRAPDVSKLPSAAAGFG
jgi:hypothetical protein